MKVMSILGLIFSTLFVVVSITVHPENAASFLIPVAIIFGLWSMAFAIVALVATIKNAKKGG